MCSGSSVSPLRVGDTLYGFCNGYFGRDSYSDKKVEAIAADWVVCRHVDGGLVLYVGDPEFLCQYREKPADNWPDNWP